MIYRMRSRWLPWAIFLLLWLVAAGLLIFGIRTSGNPPIDAATYFQAVEDVRAGVNPYGSPAEVAQTWLAYHGIETDILAGTFDAEGVPFLPGPYIYLPTLLQFIQLLRIGSAGFVLIVLASVIFFCWFWLRITGASPWWLLLVVFSWDVLASFSGANIELVLLAALLGAAWLLWKQEWPWAAPLIAVAVITKPFYALFFAAFGLLMLSTRSERRTQLLRVLVISAAVAVGLIVLAVVMWPTWLRTAAFEYLFHGLAYTWYSLPVDSQTPMSIWNRTLMQGLANMGVSAQTAQFLSIGGWVLLTMATVWWTHNRHVGFALAFGTAFVLSYWFRPVGWTFIYLDFVVLTAVWPYTRRWERWTLLLLALALNLSHWLALALTLQQQWLRLFTLQSATYPWETWLVLPFCWIALLIAMRRVAGNTAENTTQSHSDIRWDVANSRNG